MNQASKTTPVAFLGKDFALKLIKTEKAAIRKFRFAEFSASFIKFSAQTYKENHPNVKLVIMSVPARLQTKSTKTQNWQNSEVKTTELDKILNRQNSEWEKIPNGRYLELNKIPNWTKSRIEQKFQIEQNPERVKIQNGENSELDKISNGQNSEKKKFRIGLSDSGICRIEIFPIRDFDQFRICPFWIMFNSGFCPFEIDKILK